MQPAQLRAFVAAAEAGGIAAGARRLGMAQPGLTRHLGELERSAGARLLDRGRKGSRLTAAGRWLLPRARRLLADLETVGQQFEEQHGRGGRTLRVGCIGPLMDDLALPAVEALGRDEGRWRVAVFALTPQEQLDRLREGELDAAILANAGEADWRRYRSQVVLRTRMAAVLPRRHRLTFRPALRLGELRHEAWASLDESVFPGRREFLLEGCRRAGFAPRDVREAPSLEAMFAMIAASGRVGIAPLHAAKLPHAGCVFVPLTSPSLRTEVRLLRPRRASVDRAMEAWSRALVAQGSQVAARPTLARGR